MCGATEGGLSLDGIDVKKEAIIQGQVHTHDGDAGVERLRAAARQDR